MQRKIDMLAYRARDGIYETRFPEDNTANAETLNEFVMRGIRLSLEIEVVEGFMILDTFLSDTISETSLEFVLKAAMKKNKKVRILLLDPRCRYARARAHALNGPSSLERSSRGLEMIANVLEGILGETRPGGISLEGLARHIRQLGKSVGLEIRFYDRIPSGPMMIFGSLALTGSFSASHSSRDLPWNTVVRDPYIDRGLYRILADEFDYIWEQSEMPSTYKVFVSFNMNRSDKAEKFVDILSSELGIEVTISKRDLKSGQDWKHWIAESIRLANEVVVITGNDGSLGNWGLMEIGAGWSFQKPIVFCLEPGEPIPDLIKELGPHAITDEDQNHWESVRVDIRQRADEFAKESEPIDVKESELPL